MLIYWVISIVSWQVVVWLCAFQIQAFPQSSANCVLCQTNFYPRYWSGLQVFSFVWSAIFTYFCRPGEWMMLIEFYANSLSNRFLSVHWFHFLQYSFDLGTRWLLWDVLLKIFVLYKLRNWSLCASMWIGQTVLVRFSWADRRHFF